MPEKIGLYGFKDFLDRDERTNMQKVKKEFTDYYGARSPSWKLDGYNL